MIRTIDIDGIIDALSQEFAAKRSERIVAIAVLGSAFKSAVAQAFAGLPVITQYADILDACAAIDATEECSPAADIATDVLAYRERAYALLSQRIYAEKLHSAKQSRADLTAVSDEYRIAGLVASWLKQNRTRLPTILTPEWIEQHADPSFVFTLKQYIYDIGPNEYSWQAFAVLLPENIRRKFDPTKVGLSVPSGFSSDDEAEAYLRKLLAHHGLTPQDIAYSDRVRTLMDVPGFRVVLEHFGNSLWDKELRDADGGDDQAVSSSSPLPT